MREQVVTPRGSTKSASTTRSGASGVAQRPLKRDRVRGGKSNNDRLSAVKRVLEWVPKAVKIGLGICLVVFVFAGYRAAASASFFQIRSIDVNGTSRISTDEIKSIVRRVGGPTGVWRADLDQLSQEIGRLTWVKSAVVSRVLPDGIRVRIVERTPRGVVHLSKGIFVWADEDAVELGEIKTTDALPPFFLRGWDEEGSPQAKADNKERMKQYLELVDSFDAAGVAERVSEVDLFDLKDVRAHLAGDYSSIEIQLGKEDFAKRMQQGLKLLDNKRGAPRFEDIISVNLVQGTRAVVGLSNGSSHLAQASDLAVPTQEDANGADGAAAANAPSPEPFESSAKGSSTTKRAQDRETDRTRQATAKKTDQKKNGKGTERPQSTARR